VIVVLPAATPVIIPEVKSTVATAVVLLLQLPPAMLLLNIMVEPLQTEAGPLIVPAVGTGLTVIVADADADPQTLVTE
jgi:hypothetical protein